MFSIVNFGKLEIYIKRKKKRIRTLIKIKNNQKYFLRTLFFLISLLYKKEKINSLLQ